MSPLRHGRTRVDVEAGKTIFDYADELRVKVPTSCGRTGRCHECIIEVTRGMDSISPRSEPESFLRGTYRLACQANILEPEADIAFGLMNRKRQIITSGRRHSVALDPVVRRVGDAVYHDETRLDAYRGAIYGLAIDLGTTTVVMNLLDLESGRLLFTSSFENPQRFGGSDVMHRISYDAGPYRGELHLAIVNAISSEVREMSRQLRFSRRLIYDVVVVGNATMRDLFFGLDVQTIGEKPYKSLTELEMRRGERSTTTLETTARGLGLRVNPNAPVYGAPLIASHVGADVVADLLAIGMDEFEGEEVAMLVDIGTNTEVVVGNARGMLAASCPAGPAFEGGFISYGMPGFEGAIESVQIEGEHVRYCVIGGGDPVGICGSGLIDLIAELRRTGRMNELGVFADGGKTFSIVPEKGITLSRADASQLAQAKAANFCGQSIVLRAYGAHPERIGRLYLAGGFANYVDVENAIAIGFIPDLPLDRIVKVGNAALEGATMLLISREKRAAAERIVRRIEHVELETSPDFFEMFVEGCQFKPLDVARLQPVG